MDGWSDQRVPSASKEEEGGQYGCSEVVVLSGRQVDRISTPFDVQREANVVQDEANEA